MMADRDKILRELDICRQQLDMGPVGRRASSAAGGRRRGDPVLGMEDDMVEVTARKEEDFKVRILSSSLSARNDLSNRYLRKISLLIHRPANLKMCI